MVLSFRKFISKVFVNGKCPKILPSENFPLYGSTHHEVQDTSHHPDNTVIVLKKWGPGECHTNRGKMKVLDNYR